MTTTTPTTAPTQAPGPAATPPIRAVTPPAEIPDLVRRYGLQRAGARQPLAEYTRQLWDRRRFINSYSRAMNAAGYTRSFLGQAWQLLTPLLNVAVYYLVFGFLLHSNRHVHNYIGFLAVGVFVFAYCTAAVNQGSKAITSNLGLTRALQFPRAVLPVAMTMIAFLQLLYSLIILIPLLLITGERPGWHWFELIPSFALLSCFCLGVAFFFARVGAKVPDTSQTLPYVTRVWMYLSGVMFSIPYFLKGHAEWFRRLLEVNPANVYLTLARHSLMSGVGISKLDIILAVVWAVVPLVGGYLYFWRGEEDYGNV